MISSIIPPSATLDRKLETGWLKQFDTSSCPKEQEVLIGRLLAGRNTCRPWTAVTGYGCATMGPLVSRSDTRGPALRG